MADWVIVVDDDMVNLNVAGRILSKEGIRVTALKSGQSLLDYLSTKDKPDLILLDLKMPEMDGFETYEKMRALGGKNADVPVIFLTADENRESEAKGLSMGAMDFIKKPFIPEVLTLRVKHIIELNHLQKSLALEVEKKTQENDKLFFHVVTSPLGSSGRERVSGQLLALSAL